MTRLRVVPLSLRQANDFVQHWHRHNGRTSRDGGKFAIGASDGERLIGVAIVGRPLSRILAADDYTAEVLRCCVAPGADNACSFLYAASWRAWKALGGRKLITYTLQTESGASLRGAGWRVVAESRPHKNGWSTPTSGRERDWQPIYGQAKFRWEVESPEATTGGAS